MLEDLRASADSGGATDLPRASAPRRGGARRAAVDAVREDEASRDSQQGRSTRWNPSGWRRASPRRRRRMRGLIRDLAFGLGSLAEEPRGVALVAVGGVSGRRPEPRRLDAHRPGPAGLGGADRGRRSLRGHRSLRGRPLGAVFWSAPASSLTGACRRAHAFPDCISPRRSELPARTARLAPARVLRRRRHQPDDDRERR